MPAVRDPAGAERAYELLRTAIVENRYAPGQRLIEQKIAEELGLSRTPVREALRRLEAEGLVVTEAHRGATVRPITINDVIDLYDLRARLEAYAAQLAAERSTPDERAVLAEAVRAFGEATASFEADGDDALRRLVEANRAVHDCILAAAHHDRLATMIARTVDIPLVYRSIQRFGPDERARSDLFHRLVLAAIERGDAERAGALMAEHVRQGLDVVLDAIAGNGAVDGSDDGMSANEDSGPNGSVDGSR